MEVVTSETCIEVPCDEGAVDTARENKQVFDVKGATHDILSVHKWGRSCGQVTATDRIFFFAIVTTVIAVGRVQPDVELSIPAHSEEARSFDSLVS